jgi:phosphosulfolactate phosphohydrolase-like enzyme
MMKGQRKTLNDRMTVAIDSISESPRRRGEYDAIVLVDVVCDTTTLVTSVAQGRFTYPSASAPAAQHLARTLREPILAAQPDEAWRPGFEFGNSPAALAALTDRRPLVLTGSTGASLALNEPYWPDVYLVCFRNIAATARHLAENHRHVLILDAAHAGDVRCEDQMVAARVAGALVEAGYEPVALGTRGTIERWARADVALVSWGRSAEELRRLRRHQDVQFVIDHVDDLDLVCGVRNGRATAVAAELHLRDVSVTA